MGIDQNQNCNCAVGHGNQAVHGVGVCSAFLSTTEQSLKAVIPVKPAVSARSGSSLFLPTLAHYRYITNPVKIQWLKKITFISLSVVVSVGHAFRRTGLERPGLESFRMLWIEDGFCLLGSRRTLMVNFYPFLASFCTPTGPGLMQSEKQLEVRVLLRTEMNVEHLLCARPCAEVFLISFSVIFPSDSTSQTSFSLIILLIKHTFLFISILLLSLSPLQIFIHTVQLFAHLLLVCLPSLTPYYQTEGPWQQEHCLFGALFFTEMKYRTDEIQGLREI